MNANSKTMIENKHNTEMGIRSPDGRLLAVPGQRHTVLILDAATHELWVTYYGHQAGVYQRVCGTIRALVWLPDGNCIASGSTDGSIHLWHARSGTHRRILTQPQEGCTVIALTLSHQGCLCALRERDVKTWQLC